MEYPYSEGVRQLAYWKPHRDKAVLTGPKKGALVVPCRDPDGHITGARLLPNTIIKSTHEDPAALTGNSQKTVRKWRWWPHRSSNPLLPLSNGDLPLHVVKGKERGRVVLLENIVDAVLPAKRWGLDTIARANGASFADSQETLVQYLLQLDAQEVLLAPDQSDCSKNGPAHHWYSTALLLEDEGFIVRFVSSPPRRDNVQSVPDLIRNGVAFEDCEVISRVIWSSRLPTKIRNYVVKTCADEWSRRGLQEIDEVSAVEIRKNVDIGPATVIEYAPDPEGSVSNRIRAWQNASATPPIFADASSTGTGKTRAVSELDPGDFGVQRIIYLTGDARNATDDIKNNYVLADARHTGLVKASDGRIVRVDRLEDNDDPPNCLYTEHFVTLREKRLSFADQMDICMGCREKRACEAGTHNHNKYLFDHRQAISSPRVSCNYLTFSPSMLAEGGNVVIIDEAERVLKPERVKVSKEDIKCLQSDLNNHAPDLGSELEEFFKSLLSLIRQASRKKYGFGVGEVFSALAPLTEDMDYFLPLRLEKFLRNTLPSLSKWNSHHRGKKLADIQSLPVNWLPDVICLLRGDRKGGLQIDRRGLTMTLPQRAFVDGLFDSRIKKVILLDATGSGEHLAGLLGLGHDIPTLRQSGKTVRPYRIQVCGVGNLTPKAKRKDRQQQFIKKLVDEFVAIYGEDTVVFEHTSQVTEDGSAKFDADSSVTVGRYWVNTRGTNDYDHCPATIAVGIPLPPIGDMEAEYASIHGVPGEGKARRLRYVGCTQDGMPLANGVTEYNDRFLAHYIRRKTRIELLQLEGRLRAERRPDEQLTIIYITDYPLGFEVDEVRLVRGLQTQSSLHDLNRKRHNATIKKIESVESVIGSLQNFSIREIAEKAGVSTKSVQKWKQEQAPREIKSV